MQSTRVDRTKSANTMSRMQLHETCRPPESHFGSNQGITKAAISLYHCTGYLVSICISSSSSTGGDPAQIGIASFAALQLQRLGHKPRLTFRALRRARDVRVCSSFAAK